MSGALNRHVPGLRPSWRGFKRPSLEWGMARRALGGTIKAAMAVVLEDVLLAEDPLSPEVVLVSPPEIAHLARARPSRGRWEDAVCSARIDERVHAQPS